MGWILVAIVAPLSWLLVRDGQSLNSDANKSVDPVQNGDWTLIAAVSTPAFWVFGLATSIYGLIAAGGSLFHGFLLTERGCPREAFYEVAMIGSFVGMAANFGGGWLARGRLLRSVTATALVVLAISLALLPQVTQHWQLVLYAVGMGASGGVVTVVFFT